MNREAPSAAREKKVCLFSSMHEPSDVRMFHKECRSLARAGYAVTLVVPHANDDLVDGVRIKAVPRLNGRLSRMTVTVWRVYREALRQRADIYHFNCPELIPVALLMRLQGKKVIYDIHEDAPRDILCKYYIPLWARRPLVWLFEHFENFAARRFSVLVPATAAIAERFRPLNRNVVVISNYPYPSEFAPRSEVTWNQREHAVTYIGGLVPARGTRQMVEAMGCLPDTLRATLKLVGAFTPASLRDEVMRLRGWNRVEEIGVVDRAGVADVLGRVRAGLVLLHPEPNYIRAEPNKLFEYMAAGIPVIASDFPLWREMVEGAGCGLLADPLNPEAIARAIEYLLTHPEEAEAMGRRGRKAVEERYNWESEARKLVACYADLLETGETLLRKA